MLLNLHVKNLALIEETEVNFGQGLNILSGETGAGKSIIIGSVNLALGGKGAEIHAQGKCGLCFGGACFYSGSSPSGTDFAAT